VDLGEAVGFAVGAAFRTGCRFTRPAAGVGLASCGHAASSGRCQGSAHFFRVRTFRRSYVPGPDFPSDALLMRRIARATEARGGACYALLTMRDTSVFLPTSIAHFCDGRGVAQKIIRPLACAFP